MPTKQGLNQSCNLFLSAVKDSEDLIDDATSSATSTEKKRGNTVSV
jgi:hypothetical protein